MTTTATTTTTTTHVVIQGRHGVQGEIEAGYPDEHPDRDADELPEYLAVIRHPLGGNVSNARRFNGPDALAAATGWTERAVSRISEVAGSLEHSRRLAYRAAEEILNDRDTQD